MLASLVLSAALIVQAPKPHAKPSAPSPEREEAIRSTLAQKRRTQRRVDEMRRSKRAAEARRAQEWQLYVERVGPIIAAQQREAFAREMEARRVGAMEAIGAAAIQDAATNRSRLQFQRSQAGYGPFTVPPGYPYSRP